MNRRRNTRKVRIGSVVVGGNAPISVQSMTKADTKAVDSTLGEIRKLRKAGCEIVRVAVRGKDSIPSLRRITERAEIPVVADIHFSPQLALEAIEAGVSAIRLNPGNIKRKEDIKAIAKRAKEKKIPIRIGVNSGSLGGRRGSIADSMVRSAAEYIRIFETMRFRDIIISLKSSDVSETVEAYRKMASMCVYPFHLGITAAGPFLDAAVKSSIGIGTLLQDGIGDTIRVSLTGGSVAEVEIAREILSALKLRAFGPEVISCPTCGRCDVDLKEMVDDFKERSKEFKPGDTRSRLRVAIMGCAVNGPGEAKDADIGIAAGGRSKGVLFKKGRKVRNVRPDEFIDVLINEIKTYK